MTAPEPGDRVLVEVEVLEVDETTSNPMVVMRLPDGVLPITGGDAAAVVVGFVRAGDGTIAGTRPRHPPLPEGMTYERLHVIRQVLADASHYELAREVRGWADALDVEVPR